MYVNKFKAKVKAKQEAATLLNASWFDPVIAEMAGKAGFDAVMMDCEHGCISNAQVLEFIRACEATDVVPLIRVSDNSPGPILQYLDAGAMGIMIPDVHGKEDAIAAVKAVKYAPMGERGLSTTRASDYGLKGKLSDYTKMANEQTMVMLMVENPDAVENIEEILSVEGVDSLTIGATDLSNSMGHPGDRNHPDVVAAIDKVIAAAKKYGVPMGTMLRPGQSAAEELAKGYGLMTFSVQTTITSGMKNFIKQVKGE